MNNDLRQWSFADWFSVMLHALLALLAAQLVIALPICFIYMLINSH